MTNAGGDYNGGTLYSYTTSSNQLTVLHSFGGQYPQGQDGVGPGVWGPSNEPILYQNSLYGVVPGGYTSGPLFQGGGFIYQYDLTSNVYTPFYIFQLDPNTNIGSLGSRPTGRLLNVSSFTYYIYCLTRTHVIGI